jgi:hypothetical protein
LDERIAAVSAEIEALAKQDESCQRLMSVPGVGPIISSAVVAAIGNGAGFKQGCDFAAWLGLIPKQESTGDRSILGKISKRGNKYVRTLFVQAAHVVLERRPSTARQGKARQGKARQGKARQGKARQGKARQGKARAVALDRAGIEAASPQHAGNRARQQTCAQRLGRPRTRSSLCCARNSFALFLAINGLVGGRCRFATKDFLHKLACRYQEQLALNGFAGWQPY